MVLIASVLIGVTEPDVYGSSCALGVFQSLSTRRENGLVPFLTGDDVSLIPVSGPVPPMRIPRWTIPPKRSSEWIVRTG